MNSSILYLRVSTEDQVQYGLSLQNQEIRGRQYAEFQGSTDVRVIRDKGKTGTNTNRPGLQAVFEAVRRKDVDAVIVYSLSRFMRNTRETINAIELMKKNNVTFHSLTESIDTSTAMGKFFLVVMAAVAELESGQTGERIRSVLQTMKRNGQRVGSIPYGYRAEGGVMKSRMHGGRIRNNLKGAKLVEDVDEQAVIARIIQLRKGYSLQGVCDRLFDEGVRSRSGKKFAVTQVVRILKGIEKDSFHQNDQIGAQRKSN